MINYDGVQKITVKVDADLASLIPDFLKRRESDVCEIVSKVQTGDFERIQTLGHQMKGAGSGYGFIPISEIGAAIESEAIVKCSQKILDLARQLADYLKKVELVFE